MIEAILNSIASVLVIIPVALFMGITRNPYAYQRNKKEYIRESIQTALVLFVLAGFVLWRIWF